MPGIWDDGEIQIFPFRYRLTRFRAPSVDAFRVSSFSQTATATALRTRPRGYRGSMEGRRSAWNGAGIGGSGNRGSASVRLESPRSSLSSPFKCLFFPKLLSKNRCSLRTTAPAAVTALARSAAQQQQTSVVVAVECHVCCCCCCCCWHAFRPCRLASCLF